MKTDYAGHERAYQRKRQDPGFAGWSEKTGLAEDWQFSWAPLLQQASFPKRGQLVELGSGAGKLSIYFAKLRYSVTGVEISPTAINWARENAANTGVEVDFIQGDVLTCDSLADGTFDIAFDGRCLHCIIGRDRAQFLQTAYRILKIGGVLVINTMCNQVPDSSYWQAHFDPQTRCIMNGDLATRYIGDSNDILQEIIQAQFRILHVNIFGPQDKEDLADLHVIAEKRLGSGTGECR